MLKCVKIKRFTKYAIFYGESGNRVSIILTLKKKLYTLIINYHVHIHMIVSLKIKLIITILNCIKRILKSKHNINMFVIMRVFNMNIYIIFFIPSIYYFK